MKVGLFDHVERSERALATQYDERFKFAAAADEAGFYCYHVAEHHCTPLTWCRRRASISAHSRA